MKPVIVWVLLVDKMKARILESQGPDTGLVQLPGRFYEAPAPLSCLDDEGRALVGNTGARVRLEKRIIHTHESIQFVRKKVVSMNTHQRPPLLSLQISSSLLYCCHNQCR